MKESMYDIGNQQQHRLSINNAHPQPILGFASEDWEALGWHAVKNGLRTSLFHHP